MLPGGYIEMNSYIRALTEEEITAITGEKRFLYCIGTVFYEDGFGKSRTTRFCASHNPKRDNWRVCANNNWAE